MVLYILCIIESMSILFIKSELKLSEYLVFVVFGKISQLLNRVKSK